MSHGTSRFGTNGTRQVHRPPAPLSKHRLLFSQKFFFGTSFFHVINDEETARNKMSPYVLRYHYSLQNLKLDMMSQYNYLSAVQQTIVNFIWWSAPFTGSVTVLISSSRMAWIFHDTNGVNVRKTITTAGVFCLNVYT